MTSLDVAWRALHEPFSGDTYVVSPQSGSLYLFSSEDWQKRISQADLDAIGCHARERVEHLPELLSADDRIPEFLTRPRLWTAVARLRLAACGWGAHALGMRRFLARVRPGHVRRSPEEILRDIKSAEGPMHGEKCLPRAVARWSALVRAGFEPKLMLGVAVPAVRLHAWVTLGDTHIGEDIDEIVQYRPAVSYAPARARDAPHS